MSFNPRYYVGREEYFVPSSSTYLWNQSDALNDVYGKRLFSALIQKKQDSNDPRYHFSSSTAYNDEALSRVAEPLRSALSKKIASVNLLKPATFISYSELDAMKFPHMRLITSQWVIFNQDPHSHALPSLSIASHDNGAYLDVHPVVMSGECNLADLHTEYTLIGKSMNDVHGHKICGLITHTDDGPQLFERMKDRAPDLRDAFKLKSVDEVDMVQLHVLDAQALGFTSPPVTVVDDEGTARRFGEFNIDDGTKINFIAFGLVKPEQDMVVHFPDPGVKALRYDIDGEHAQKPGAQQPVMSGILRQLLDTFEANGTWPQRERPQRSRAAQIFRRMFRMGD